MSTITVKQFFRNVFYIMLTLSATPYMLLSTFLSLFMDVPVISLSMEIYLPGYELAPKEQEEKEEEEEEDEEEEEEDEEEEDEDEDEDEDEEEEDRTSPVLAPINVENHHNINNSGHCTPIPRHTNEPESPMKRRPTDIEDDITPRILEEDFKTMDLPTIQTPPSSPKQETSESSSSAENDE